MSGGIRSEVLHRRFTFEYELGQWTFGTTQVLKDRKSGDLKTCKSVLKSCVQGPAIVAARLHELCKLDHPHLFPVAEILEDKQYLFIISDRCKGGDLDDWLEKLDERHWVQEEIAAAYIGQALVALAYCHTQRVYHRDLRPGNILLSSRMPDATVMLSDFGVQAILDPMNRAALMNPNPYVAPELTSESGRVICGGACDVWSIGAIAHLLLVGSAPSNDSGWDLSAERFLRGSLHDDAWAERSSASRDFVQQLLQPAGDRPTAASMLQHPWLKNIVIPRVGPGQVGHGDIQQKMLCYMLAVLLVPAVVPYRDFCQLRREFKRIDDDYDGLLLRNTAEELFYGRSQEEIVGQRFQKAEIQTALEIADVRGTGVLDLCATACAAIFVRVLTTANKGKRRSKDDAYESELTSATDLVPLLLDSFFKAYGNQEYRTVDYTSLSDQLRNNVGRDMEMYAGIAYTDILLPFVDTCIDPQRLVPELVSHAGRGTPLAYVGDDGEESSVAEDEEQNSCFDPFSFAALQSFFGGALESCGIKVDASGQHQQQRGFRVVQEAEM